MNLFAIELNQSDRNLEEAVVFLHGFGGWAHQWHDVQRKVSKHIRTISFDLPGHGRSLYYPDFGPPKTAAKAVINELQRLNVTRAHVVGHSMGGAVASLIALFAPQLVSRMTLLAPGGFSEDIDNDTLNQWARVQSREDIAHLLEKFVACDFEIPDDMINGHLAVRQDTQQSAALVEIAQHLFTGPVQNVLPLQNVFEGGIPTTLLWGEEDSIVPSKRVPALPTHVEVNNIERVGHMLIEEAPDLVLKAILKQL